MIDPPSASSTIDWLNSRLVTLHRTAAMISQAGRSPQYYNISGTAFAKCFAKSLTKDTIASKIIIMWGQEAKASRKNLPVRTEAEAVGHQTLLPATKTYLAVISKSPSEAWNDNLPYTVRVLIPLKCRGVRGDVGISSSGVNDYPNDVRQRSFSQSRSG